MFLEKLLFLNVHYCDSNLPNSCVVLLQVEDLSNHLLGTQSSSSTMNIEAAVSSLQQAVIKVSALSSHAFTYEGMKVSPLAACLHCH